MQIDIPAPNEKQERFFLDKHKFCCFGGARGGGKSWSVRVKSVLLSIKHPGIKILIVRRTFPELVSNHINPMKQMLMIGTPKAVAKYNDRDKEIRFANGSTIKFDYCNTASAIDHYQGREFDVIFLDEATQLSEEQIRAIVTCMRSTSNKPRRCYFTANPGGRGHQYIKRLFIDRNYVEGEYPEEYSFIQSLVYDNKALMSANEDYLHQLEALPESLRKAWLEGDWNSFQGQCFPLTNDSAHYKDRQWTHVIDKLEFIPENWKIYRGFDFGYSKPFSVAWYGIDHAGRIYRFKEWYGCTKTPNTGIQLTPQEIAEGIIERERSDPRLKGRKITGIADPAIWEKSHGESIADMMEQKRVYWNKGDHARLAGKMQFHYRLAFDEMGIPMFYVTKDCEHFIRTIPSLIYDEKNVEDIDTSLEDHIYDECRYVFMEHPLNPRRSEKKRPPEEDPLDLWKGL